MSEFKPLEIGDRVAMAHRYGVAVITRIFPPAYVTDTETIGEWEATIELPHRTPEYRYENVPLALLTRAE
jgi:hypothetical protein